MADETRNEEGALFSSVHELFTERIPFNKLLGIHIDSMSFESARIRFDFRDELVGNFLRGSLHGGVVSAGLDLTGGLVAFLSAAKNAVGSSHEEKLGKPAARGTGGE